MNEEYEIIFKAGGTPQIHYASNVLNWAWCAAPNKKGKVKQLSEWTNCRETHSMNISRDVTTAGKLYGIDLRRARLILRAIAVRGKVTAEKKREAFFEKMVKSTEFINILEKEFKWSLTRMYPLYYKGSKNSWEELKEKKPGIKGIYIMAMFIGSPKWIRSPHMASLWTLLIRAGGHKALWSPKNYDDLMIKVRKYIDTSKTLDQTYVKTSYQYWGPLMKNYKKLFAGMPIARNYDSDRAWRGNYGSGEGIRKLCLGRSFDKKLQARFNKEIKAHAGKAATV